MIEIFIYVDPGALAINRARRCQCVSGRPSSRPGKKFEEAIGVVHITAKMQLKRHGLPVYPDGPVVVEYVVRPKQVHREGPSTGQARLDVDAASKALLDALNGAAYTDDSQVERVIGSKTTEGPVGIRVRIYRPEEA